MYLSLQTIFLVAILGYVLLAIGNIFQILDQVIFVTALFIFVLEPFLGLVSFEVGILVVLFFDLALFILFSEFQFQEFIANFNLVPFSLLFFLILLLIFTLFQLFSLEFQRFFGFWDLFIFGRSILGLVTGLGIVGGLLDISIILLFLVTVRLIVILLLFVIILAHGYLQFGFGHWFWLWLVCLFLVFLLLALVSVVVVVESLLVLLVVLLFLLVLLETPASLDESLCDHGAVAEHLLGYHGVPKIIKVSGYYTYL